MFFGLEPILIITALLTIDPNLLALPRKISGHSMV